MTIPDGEHRETDKALEKSLEAQKRKALGIKMRLS